MKRQGSTLIIALALMMFVTTLGTIVLHAAYMMRALSIERSLYRPSYVLLESLIIYACKTQGREWLAASKKNKKTITMPPYVSYTAIINGTTCELHVAIEKERVVVHASCPGRRGVIHTLKAYLENVGERIVIRAWQRL